MREAIHDVVAELKGATADFSTSKLRMAEDMAECLSVFVMESQTVC